jgi:hypothetical protein
VDAMLWWLIPITATLLAVAWVSWNGRTRRPADPHDTLAAHKRFTDALASPAPEVSRPSDAEETDDSDPAPERRRSA